MKLISYILTIIALTIAVMSCPEVYSLIPKEFGAYKWVLCGIGAYLPFAGFLVASRESIVRVFTHEMTHAVAGTLFFRKIVSFNATTTSGVVFHSKGLVGDIFIALAPYCLPIYTFAFLILRLLGAESSLFIFDILIGFTLAMHINCFALETRPRQTDIKKSGYALAALFLLTAWIVNLSIIALSFPDGIWHSLTSLFHVYKETVLELFNLMI